MRSLLMVLATSAVFLSPPAGTPVLGQETMRGFLQEEYSCIMCHTEMRTDFLEGVHSGRGILCTDCHGGDASEFEIETAHTGDFVGALSKAEAVAQCLSCHGDIPQMRQYALEPVTREEYLISRHGQSLLLEGDTLAPSCGDCHGSHAIYPRTDPRSPVSPARISSTCAECHSDPSRVPEGLPVGQYEEWTGSAHGQALLVRHNEQSAHCASCHGSHSALPPGAQEIPNVCGKCHQLVREAYYQGPHGQARAGAEGGVPCTGCHANHETAMPSFSDIGSLCQTCHAPESAEAVAGLELQELILHAEAASGRAHEAVEILVEAGERTEDEEIRLQELDTNVRRLMVSAHTLDPVAVDESTRGILSWAEGVVQRAESVEEHRWERKLLGIPLWLLLVGGVLLALRKRRRLAEWKSRSWGLGGGMES